MKLTDEDKPSMWELIAQRPAKKAPVIRGPKPTMVRRIPLADEFEDARLNLALKGVLTNDGGWKF